MFFMCFFLFNIGKVDIIVLFGEVVWGIGEFDRFGVGVYFNYFN